MHGRAGARWAPWRWALCSVALTSALLTALVWERSAADFDGFSDALGYAVTSMMVYGILATPGISLVATVLAAASILWRPASYRVQWLLAFAVCTPVVAVLMAIAIGPVG